MLVAITMKRFFQTVAQNLGPDGVAVIHAIGKTGEALSNNP